MPKLNVTRAVAVQIFRLLYVKDARSALMASEWRSPARSLYIMLASLAHGARTEPPDAGAGVESDFACCWRGKALSSPLGLGLQFQRMTADDRRNDFAELRDLSLRRCLW